MKKKLILATLLTNFASLSVTAMDLRNCSSKLFKELELTANTGHSSVLARPKGRLLALSHQYEIMCPWQLEGDFNGDNRNDWIGLAQKDGKYSLLAYLSGPRKHYVQKLKEYPEFPSDMHLSKTTFKSIFIRSGNKLNSIFPAQMVFIENVIDKNATVYGWRKDKLMTIHHYEGDYKLNQLSLEERKKELLDDDDQHEID